MNPVISIIIPTYQRHTLLAELLESLYRQTFKDFEVIIVNDAGASVQSVVRLYPELQIKLIELTENVKHVAARNTALQAASGEWIMPCDDDDLLVPTHLETMLLHAKHADFLYSDAEIVHFEWDEERKTRMPRARRLFAYHYDPQGMRTFSTYVPSGSLYRRMIHSELGDFDTAMYHYWDWDFILRASSLFRVSRVPVASVLYAFEEAGDNLSSDLDNMRPYLDRLCAKHGLGQLPTKNFFLLLEEPAVKARESKSRIVWDGLPIRSRWSSTRS